MTALQNLPADKAIQLTFGFTPRSTSQARPWIGPLALTTDAMRSIISEVDRSMVLAAAPQYGDPGTSACILRWIPKQLGQEQFPEAEWVIPALSDFAERPWTAQWLLVNNDEADAQGPHEVLKIHLVPVPADDNEVIELFGKRRMCSKAECSAGVAA